MRARVSLAFLSCPLLGARWLSAQAFSLGTPVELLFPPPAKMFWRKQDDSPKEILNWRLWYGVFGEHGTNVSEGDVW